MITPGIWSAGKVGGTVISDTIPPDYKPGSGHDHIEYYGGFCVAESAHKDDVKLIAAAPDLLQSLKRLEKYVTRSLTLKGLEEKEIEFITGHARAALNKAETNF